MKRTSMSQSGLTEPADRDRPPAQDARARSRRLPWVLILALPVLIIALVIGLEIFGLIVRLSGG
ncbi:hypothetical protein [Paraburkholderia pallida]|uniref:Uncharacterized protein n=1 Tax=Paraburkholderia pallida TaxID=2547399 RepID=A0A4P7CY45_9BURK|nr:hypothetical protein [Paraburkholderia pallida]QBR01189.1 hypothetical protein E1956_28665 [Paraburkholderia pallida]